VYFNLNNNLQRHSATIHYQLVLVV